MASAKIELPYPPAKLNPNRLYRSKLAHNRVVQEYRGDCMMIARTALFRAECPGLTLKISIHPPDNRRRDVQNVIAAMKAAIDGLADAWGVDDSSFIIEWPAEFGSALAGGRIYVEVSD